MVSAYNLNGSTASQNVDESGPTSGAIYDYPSYQYLHSSINNPVNIPVITTISATGIPGYRIWSAPDSTQVTGATGSSPTVVIPPAYGYINNLGATASYSTIKYDQTWSIIKTNTAYTGATGGTINTSSEIQLFNGKYQGVTAAPYSSNGIVGYENYSKYYNNSLNYSGIPVGISSYRYVTMCWKITASSGDLNFNKYNFTLKNCNCSAEQQSNGTYVFKYGTSNQSTRFFLFYRTEQIDPSNILVNPTDSNSLSSIWLDGNLTTGGIDYDLSSNAEYNSTIPVVSNTNYYNYGNLLNSIIRSNAGLTVTQVSNDLLVSVSAYPTSIPNGKSIYVFCRLGIPMVSFNVSFDYLSLNLV